jgi:hypothetical protein
VLFKGVAQLLSGFELSTGGPALVLKLGRVAQPLIDFEF